MHKYPLLLILPLLSLGTNSCSDDEDVPPIDLNLFAGTWEVVVQDNQEVFRWEEILDITETSQIHNGYGGYQGYITTYFLKYDGTPIHDRDFSWSILKMENHHPLLDVVLQGDIDSDDTRNGNYCYRITKLTGSHMWWRINSEGNDTTIKLRRRTDIKIE